MFDADRPITKSSQDKLNRTSFAKHLARCLLEHKDPESLVVGLYGGWGVGKTSVIHLVLEELTLASNNMFDEEKPIILNFSPWSYSGGHELIYSFFRRLSSALRSTPYLENKDQLIYLLELYVSFFTHKPIPHALRLKESLVDKLLGKNINQIHGWESGRDLTQVKAELNHLLRKQKHKIIVIVDNISRLYADEIKQIFQIVKSMGDYANTAYLLAFDKEQVIRSINKLEGSGGEDLVEKVVQLPFAIPPILTQDLENIFADRLTDTLASVPADSWNVEYWADIYYTSLKYFFKTGRDISRYVNTLNFSYPRLSDVTNPIDYFALTAIEVFMPHVYDGIRNNKDLFTDLLDHVYVLDQEQIAKDRLRCDEIVNRNDHLSPTILLELIMRLFPRIRRIYQPNVAFYHSETLARRYKRICNPDFFDVYFRLSMQTGQLLESEFETFLSLANNMSAFDQALTRLNQDNRITKFLDMLDSGILENIPKDNISAIIHALLDNGDLFPYGTRGALSLNVPMRIHRIIHRLLQRLPSAERFSIMESAIKHATKSVHSIIHELFEQAREHQQEEDTYLPEAFRDLTTEQLGLLRKQAVLCIESWAEDNRLEEHPQLISILFAWHNWGNAEQCQRYVAKITDTDHGLLAFLVAILNKPIKQAMDNYQRNPAWDKYLKETSHFIAPQKLVPRAKKLFEDSQFDKLREKEQLALMIFLDLVKADTSRVIGT